MTKTIYTDPYAAAAARATQARAAQIRLARAGGRVEDLIRDLGRVIRDDTATLAEVGDEYRDPPSEAAGLYAELARLEGMLAAWMVFTGKHDGEDMPDAGLHMTAAAEQIRVDLPGLRDRIAALDPPGDSGGR
jgi:hypothetical protein